MTGWILVVTIAFTNMHIPMGMQDVMVTETFQHQWKSQEECMQAGAARKAQQERNLAAMRIYPDIEFHCHETYGEAS